MVDPLFFTLRTGEFAEELVNKMLDAIMDEA